MTPEFDPAAQEELAAAVKIGDMRAAGFGRELLREAKCVIALLCNLPDIREPLDDRYRRLPLRRFPFGVIYRLDGSYLRTVAFAPRRQRPGYWIKRKGPLTMRCVGRRLPSRRLQGLKAALKGFRQQAARRVRGFERLDKATCGR